MKRDRIRGSSNVFLAHGRLGQPLARWSDATCLAASSMTIIVPPDLLETERDWISCYYRVRSLFIAPAFGLRSEF